ncbi:2-keto-4-pentenoate hydratase [Pseudonocardia sp. TRM90224]|uniref:2-keto-4-pentenoate hydratase n=1 Tax=Pseudonocardia sp. TRM90224 TaxID=2812678 RepID=UPI001E373B61|nr:fumarylacetoacetate hydrolase family protein [Pseudonocardia sp. TRM90224]
MNTPAEIIGRSRLDRAPLGALPEAHRPVDVVDGYRVQDAVHAYLTSEGHGGLVGYKIGCTTPVMQAFLDIAHPCAGGIFASTVRTGEIAMADFVRVGVECELAVRLGADLGGEVTLLEAAGAVGACMAAIELVDDRYVDFTTLGAPTLIADDFFGAGCVIGPENTGFDPTELRSVTASMSVDGERAGEGAGTDVLGDPLNALVWLAGVRQLRRGQIVLLGSVVKTAWLDGPAEVVVSNQQLGDVTARFV